MGYEDGMVIVYGHKNYLIGDSDKNKNKNKNKNINNQNSNYSMKESVNNSYNQQSKINKINIYRE